ncbi:MAG: small subunit ribosomal protein, partial [Acidobacteriota bacterium]|nr:small subunit ribosomal protein [Acidobacteriota bacterium]
MSTENEKPTNGDNTNEQPAPGASSGEAGERGDTAASASAAATATAEQPTSAAAPAAAPTAGAEQPAVATDQPAVTPAQAEAPPPQAMGTAPAQASATPARAAEASDSDEEETRGGGGGDFDFGAMLDQYEQEQAAYQEGSVVRGTVVGVNDRMVVIDFGFKSEGAVPIEEFMEEGELTVKRGDEVEVLIKSMESQEGVPILSRADAVRMRAWDDLEQAYRDGVPVKGRIMERVKGGLRVDVDGVAAFLPGSQVDVRPIRNLESLRGQEIEAMVIKLNRKRSNVVLSRKAILESENEGKKGETLNNLEEGIIVEGQIKNLTDYGAFVDLGGIDGLL